MARRFDPARREISGDPVTVAESVAVSEHGAFSVSATGVIAYRTGGTNPRQLTWFDRSGRLLGTLGEPDRADLLNAALSPDGRQAAVQRTVQNNLDIWLVDPPEQPASHSTRVSSCTQPGRLTELESCSHKQGRRRSLPESIERRRQ